ncbi:hypothetical protein DL768_005545 [Monosporascus sp. mg162]|nr:hypothetical protein DL768_005545 [Monosporascus sp. mg162]
MDHLNDQPLAAPPDAAPPASAPHPPPPATTESGPARRIRPATQADGEFMAEILRNSETKIEIPPAAWPKIAAARGLTVDSAKTRWGQIKRKLGLNTTAKPLPEPAQRVRKAAGGASGKGKAADSNLVAKRAVVGAAEDLGNLQDDTDRSEDEAGPSPAKKLKKEEAVVKTEEDEDKDEKKPVAVKEEEAEDLKKEEEEVKEEEEEEKKPPVKTEDD